MSRKARLWIGITLFIILALNYAIIGIPLIKKERSIRNKANAILIRQVKSGNMFKGSDEEFVLELFRKEKAVLDRNILILNCVVISAAIIIASWTIFGLILHKRR